jgi:hypothetical protein
MNCIWKAAVMPKELSVIVQEHIASRRCQIDIGQKKRQDHGIRIVRKLELIVVVGIVSNHPPPPLLIQPEYLAAVPFLVV